MSSDTSTERPTDDITDPTDDPAADPATDPVRVPRSGRPRIGIIGGGSAAEQLARTVSGQADVLLFEPGLVGGECPFLACMPSKSMLHDARSATAWDEAIERRQRITERLDDSDHADTLREDGATLIRREARVVDEHTIEADGVQHGVDHIVLATGSEPVIPDLDGPAPCLDALWTSEDVFTSMRRPDRVAIIGGGVVGFEIADLYSRFGTEVTVVERGERPLATVAPEVVAVIVDALEDAGVSIRTGVEAVSLEPVGDAGRATRVQLSNGTSVEVDRVIAAVGRRPNLDGLGLDALGLDPTEPLPIDGHGRVRCPGSVWAIGDVAGRGQYTHVAVHQADVVADRLTGTATRSYDEVTISSCLFTTPPLVRAGASWADVVGDPDVVCIDLDITEVARSSTDELDRGHLWMAARRSSGTVVGAAGAGPRFDELIHAIVVAIDGAVPVARLRHSMQPFPTIGELLGLAWSGLHDQIVGAT